jgi:hypothetical protein
LKIYVKKDIIKLKVEGIFVAIVREKSTSGQAGWYVYLINDNDFAIENVLITSRGYGSINGEPRKTSILRQLFDRIEPRSSRLVEPISPELFALCNEFWVSYYLGREIYDKKYIFLPETLSEKYIKYIDQVGLEGVLHS